MSAKSMATKRAMVDALKSLLAEMPLSKVTVSGVTKRAGVDRQTFYYHFDTLEDLVSFACHEALSSVQGAFGPQANVEQTFLAVIRQVDASRDLLAPLLRGSGRPVMRQVLYDDLHKALLDGARALVGDCCFATDDELEFAVLYAQHASISLAIDWLGGLLEAEPEDFAKCLAASFECQVKGLLSQAQAGKHVACPRAINPSRSPF